MSIAQRFAFLTGNAKENREFEIAKAMLNSTSINLMMVDNDGVIRYMNKSTDELMHRSEAEFNKILPRFNADNIVGQNFDIYHRNPSHQRKILANLTGTHVSDIAVDNLSFRLYATPVIGTNGERLGTVLEWLDRTSEENSVKELKTAVGAAK